MNSENHLIIPKIFSYEKLLFQCNPDFNVRCSKSKHCQVKCFKTTEEAFADITFVGPPELIIREEWIPKQIKKLKRRGIYKKLKGVH